MYTIVLLTALHGSVVTPDMGHRRGGGCCGCYGGSYGGGCYGGGCYGGGYGGCYGGGYGGCYGGGYGYAPVVYCGCMGGGAYPVMGGGVMGYTGQESTDGKKVTEDEKGGKKKDGDKGGKKKITEPDTDKEGAVNSGTSAPGYIEVTLPADARVYFDQEPTTALSGRRLFVTPSLEAGKVYRYTLTSEVVRDGRLLRVQQPVEVRSAKTTLVQVTFTPPRTVADSR